MLKNSFKMSLALGALLLKIMCPGHRWREMKKSSENLKLGQPYTQNLLATNTCLLLRMIPPTKLLFLTEVFRNINICSLSTIHDFGIRWRSFFWYIAVPRCTALHRKGGLRQSYNTLSYVKLKNNIITKEIFCKIWHIPSTSSTLLPSGV